MVGRRADIDRNGDRQLVKDGQQAVTTDGWVEFNDLSQLNFFGFCLDISIRIPVRHFFGNLWRSVELRASPRGRSTRARG